MEFPFWIVFHGTSFVRIVFLKQRCSVLPLHMGSNKRHGQLMINTSYHFKIRKKAWTAYRNGPQPLL